MTPSSTTSPVIGLAALGSLFWMAGENPRGLAAIRGGGPALEHLRGVVSDHGSSYLEEAGRFDLADPAAAATGLQSIYRAFFRDEPLRQRVLSLVRAEAYLAHAGVVDAAIRWCQKQGECPVASQLLSGVAVTGVPYPEASARRLVLAMKILQPLQMTAGAALFCESMGDLQMAEQLYKWYLIAQEQCDLQVAERDPRYLSWGQERLEAVRRARRPLAPDLPGAETVIELEVVVDESAGTAGSRSTWTIDLTEKRYTRAELTDRIRRQLVEMSPGDTILILYHAQNLFELNRDKDALKAALESMEHLDQLVGGAVILRPIDFGMQYRLTAEPAGDRLVIRTDLGQAR